MTNTTLSSAGQDVLDDSGARRDSGILHVGIDLGTSRTSVSASNGARETLASYVGYPRDVVSRKLLKKDVVFGDEAIRHRLSLNLYRPLAHGVIDSADTARADANQKAA